MRLCGINPAASGKLRVSTLRGFFLHRRSCRASALPSKARGPAQSRHCPEDNAMPYELLLLETRDKVALVTLNRPDKRNALSIALRYEIDQCLAELEADDAVSVIVVAGAGPSFCAGFDRNEFFVQTPEHQQALMDSTDRFHLRLMNFAKPLVAVVPRPALGGGLDLAVLWDVRICAG